MKLSTLFIILGLLIMGLLALYQIRSCNNKNLESEHKSEIIQAHQQRDSVMAVIVKWYDSVAQSYRNELDSLTLALFLKDSTIKQIPIKYEIIRSNVSKLPPDSQLIFFSNWLSEIRSYK